MRDFNKDRYFQDWLRKQEEEKKLKEERRRKRIIQENRERRKRHQMMMQEQLMAQMAAFNDAVINASVDSDTSTPAVATLENTVALESYAPKMQYYLTASPANGVTILGQNKILFNPGFPIEIYKTQSIQSAVIAIPTVLSAGNMLIGLYKYDYPNEKFTLITEWLGAHAAGNPKYTLDSPVDLTPGTYFTGCVCSSGSVRITYSNNTSMNVTLYDSTKRYTDQSSLINKMEYTLPSFPVTTLPTEILQSDMTIGNGSSPILAPTIIFE